MDSEIKDSISWQQLLQELTAIIKNEKLLHLTEQKEYVRKLLQNYHSKEADFKQFILFHENGYTKNLVEDFGSVCNIIIMCWSPKQESAFHGHEGSRCFVKVLKGQLTEQQVPFPDKNHSLTSSQPVIRQLNTNQVAFIDDSIGLHKVINYSSDNPAITLHIYIPAYTKCRIFKDDKNLDTSVSVDVTFQSRYGRAL